MTAARLAPPPTLADLANAVRFVESPCHPTIVALSDIEFARARRVVRAVVERAIATRAYHRVAVEALRSQPLTYAEIDRIEADIIAMPEAKAARVWLQVRSAIVGTNPGARVSFAVAALCLARLTAAERFRAALAERTVAELVADTGAVVLYDPMQDAAGSDEAADVVEPELVPTFWGRAQRVAAAALLLPALAGGFYVASSVLGF